MRLYIALQQDSVGRPQGSTDGQPAEFNMFVSLVLSKIRGWVRYRETVRELSRLTDRELDDLGISRLEIDAIARGHAHA